MLGLLLLHPKRNWTALTAGTMIGGALALMPLGAPYQNAFIGYFVVCSAIVIAANWLPGTTTFANIRVFARYLVIAVVALPAFTGWVTSVITTAAGMTPSVWPTLLAVAPAQAMGFLLLTPAVLAVAAFKKSQIRPPMHSVVEALLLLIGLVALSLGLWALVAPTPALLPLLQFAPIPLLLTAALRFGVLGSSMGLLLVALPAAGLGVYRNGPFNMNGEQADVHMLQLWMLAVALMIHPLAIQSRQRQADHRRVQKLATRLLQGQETERTRISRELHDGVAQRLAFLAIKLSAIKDVAPAHMPGRLTEVREILEDISDDVRRISHNLHPGVLEYVGLVGSLQSLVEEFGQLWDGSMQFVCECPDERPDQAVSLCLYRIAQEGLANAIKHAQAKEIILHLSRDLDHFVLLVVDDGNGFEVAAKSRSGGLGLLSMEERARLLDGTVEIRSEVGQGTRLTARVPIGLAPQKSYSQRSR